MTSALFVCSALQLGGAERQWSHLLPGLADRGFDVRLLALKDTGTFFDEIRAQRIEARHAELASRWDIRRLLTILRTTRPAQVVVSQGVNALVVGQALAWRFRAGHVAIDHTGPGLHRRLHRRGLIRLVAPHVSTVVAVTESQVEELAQLGYRRERMTVIHNGVPIPQPSRSRAELRRRFGLSDDDVAAFLIARLHPPKNVPLFVDAIRSASGAAGTIRAFIAGGGPELARIRRLVEGTSIEVLGERDDVPDLLAVADVVCLSSVTEALPMVLLEAMALGRPVLATDVGGIRDAVLDGETGILVPAGDTAAFADALVKLANDRPLRLRLGAKARERHERFSLEVMVDGYARLLERRGRT